MSIKHTNYSIYGFWGVLKLFVHFSKTKLFFPGARLIRFPIDIRGKKYIDFGTKLTTGVGCRIEAYPFSAENTVIKFGNNIQINDYVHIAAAKGVTIADDVLIAGKVFISDINHGTYNGEESDNPNTPPNRRKLSARPITIEKNVWIGESVCIMPGTTIGRGSIIGALSVVTKNIPPYSIAVGNPAKVIKEFNFTTNTWEPLTQKSEK